MTGEQRVQTIKRAIISLFQVNDLPISSRDAGYQAEMREKQMAYGILLESCSLMDMTKDAIARTVEVIKGSLHKSTMVRNSLSLKFKQCHIIRESVDSLYRDGAVKWKTLKYEN